MNGLVILSGIALVAVVAYFVVVPWMFRLLCLYGLHNAREDLYEIRQRHPALGNTLLYRDMEFVHTVAIHVVRERSALDCLSLFKRSKSEAAKRRSSKRAIQYQRELLTVLKEANDFDELEDMLGLLKIVEGLVALRVATSHPLLAAAFILGTVVFVVHAAVRVALAKPPQDGRLPQKLARSYALAGMAAPVEMQPAAAA